MIHGIWPIYKRELKAYARSTSTWVALGLLFLITGWIFADLVSVFAHDSAQYLTGGAAAPADPPNVTANVVEEIFRVLSSMILFTIPMLTMRLIASERSSGTFEVLVTCPVGDWGILLGKYFALVTVGAAVAAISAVYPLMLYVLGTGYGGVYPELAVVLSCTLGLFLIFATYGAFGLMASSFTTSQVTASIVTLIGLLGWIMVGELSVLPRPLYAIALELSALRHTEEFISGSIALRSVAFYGIASFMCLFVAARVLEARRWRV